MSGRDLRALLHLIGLTAASIAFALGAGVLANAEQIHWPWKQSPSYRQAPSHRSNPGAPPSQTREITSTYRKVTPAGTDADPPYRKVTPTGTDADPPYHPVTSNQPSQTTTPMPQPSSPPYPSPSQSAATPPAQPRTTILSQPATTTVAQPAATETQRRPQTIGLSAGSAQAAAACMNERKSASVDTAIKSCDSVIDDTLKNLANAYYFRATAKFGKRDFDGAIGDYGQALRLDPADADYFNSRAQAHEAKNDMDKALADYNQAIKANPKSIDAHNARGAAFQRKGDYARAAADYGEVTRLQPNNIDAWSARCWVRALSPGQAQTALGDCNAALKIKPDAPDVLDTRGFVYLKLGQTDNSIRDYDAALKLDPKLAGSLYGRGVAKTRKGDRAGGSEDIAQAKALKADIADEFSRYGLRP